MSDPYVGEIRMFAGTFAPEGWLFCDGSMQSIANYQVLFQLYGTTYGGDGVNTFGLPDLRGRLPIHQGSGSGLPAYVLGQTGGSESVTVTSQQLPSHTHPLQATSAAATTTAPAGQMLAVVASGEVYVNDTPTVSLNAASVSGGGSGQAHDNRSPYLTINFIVAVDGFYPSST